MCCPQFFDYEMFIYISEVLSQIPYSINEAHSGLTWDGFASLVVGSIAVLITIYNHRSIEKRDNKRYMKDMLDRLIMISIEYPYLEDASYTNNKNKNREDEKYVRYDNYCCMVFNFIERLWKYANGNKKKMNDIVYYSEYINTHYQWWLDNFEINKEGYEKGFLTLVEETIQDHK